MTRDITAAGSPATGSVDKAFEVRASFDRFCLAAGIEALGTMMEADVTPACGPRHARSRCGAAAAPLGPNAGLDRLPRRQDRGRAPAGPGRGRPRGHDPELGNGGAGGPARSRGDEPDADQCVDAPVRPGCPTARGRRAGKARIGGVQVGGLAEVRSAVGGAAGRFMAADLSSLDLLVGQIDGLHLGGDLVLVAAIGLDGEGNKHPLTLAEGATENAATVQALLDNPVSRGLFIVDGAKALSKAIRRTFGSAAAIQRCQIHKARNIMERLPKEHDAATRRVRRQAWELDDADKAEKLIRNLARRLDHQWPCVASSKASTRS